LTTFLNLKQTTVQGYNVRQMATGTTATAGTTTIIPDANRQEPQGEWDRVDSFLKITSGANLGVERRVTGFSAGVSLTVSPALSASVGSGTSYQVVKTFADSDVGLAVNSSMRETFPHRLIESFASAGETNGAFTVTVPSAASNPNANLVRIDRAVASTAFDYQLLAEGADYRVDPSVGSGSTQTYVSIKAGVSGATLRFFYRRPTAEMVADTDTTDEPVSLVIAGARKWLAIADGDPQAVERHGREFQNAKEAYEKGRAAQRIRVPVVTVSGWNW
jgi:hypothetical protein